MDIETRKHELIERLGVFIETQEGLPPMATRILATLIMEGNKGISFDEMSLRLQASKSTISTNLNLLLKLNRISYFTRTGDRKRYYTITPNIIIERLEKLLERWETEKELHLEMIAFKSACNKQSENSASGSIYDLELHEKYLNYLNGVITLVKGLKDELSNNDPEQKA